MIDGFIFDMDGTLFDTERLYIDSYITASKEYELENIEGYLAKCIGLSGKDSKELFETEVGSLDLYNELSNQTKVIINEHIESLGMPIKPGAYMLLEYLRANRYKIGLASSSSVKTIMKCLEIGKMTEYFQVIVGGDMVEKSKPHPEIYLLACEKLGVKPERAIAIEDSLNGLKSARLAGMKTIMIPDIVPFDKSMESYVDDRFYSLTDVLEAMREGTF